MTKTRPAPTILGSKQHDAPSVFTPANLLREARRQRGLPDEPVPAVCVLDPDGDIVRHVRGAGIAHKAAGWACYHTDMDVTEHAGVSIGIVGCAVGAPFAVLVAEQLFVSGLPVSRQRHVRRPDRAQGAATLFCLDRSRAAR